ncbi:serine/threonine-protein kinase AFC1 isoform X1 [Selaginella moellendorffii]|uniref:serine/threonine-protein kinase AFC1 isoform X1 n=1 Tax=Selaginella moellendorffii TaxID=88036 RepID=UPI000D1C2F19|nr:serine/threonine-protein kinase AFC1 isoform X1 [Selaginella moellendorffii]|eukprot:XP_024516992.1 serine/threonine-protein kinase AFC1 isoform X1 [Selaginella moellendorffii]
MRRAAAVDVDRRPGKRVRLWAEPAAAVEHIATNVPVECGGFYDPSRYWRQHPAIYAPAPAIYAAPHYYQTIASTYTEPQDFPRRIHAGMVTAAALQVPNPVTGHLNVVVPPQACHEDDKDGHFVFELGENITPRYKIIGKMGEGTFGRVLECWDRDTQEYVAIKLIRNVQKYRDAAMIEIDVLNELARYDRNGSRRCVQLKRWFDFRNHICMVFEKLGPSLYDFLRKNEYRPYAIDLVREFGRQLLESVAYMHDLTLIHTDLKPENILLVSPDHVKVPDFKGLYQRSGPGRCYVRVPRTSEIKLIDFGSATFNSHYHCSVISTRHYRAPEVILGLGWSYSCDIWSIGCILVELCSGSTLFQTHENLEHLAMMERIIGPLPAHMIEKAE